MLNSVINAKQLQNGGGDPLIDILRDLPDAVLMIDADGKIFYANQAAEKIFGFGASAKKMPELADILPESSPYRVAENLTALWRRVEETGHIENFETQLLDKNGRVIEVNSVKTAIHDRAGNFVGISTVIRDVTKTKESEQRISRRNAQLFALIDVAEAITQMSEVKSLLERILNAVLRVMNLSSGCVHILDEDNESLELIVEENLTRRVSRMIERFELGEGVIGQTAVLAETLLVSDTTFDRRLARPVMNEKIGSLATVPLVGRGGVVRGVLTLFNAAPRQFTEHEKSMLTGIGKQVGVALERANLLNEVTDARAEWEETFDAMTDGVSIHAPSGKIKRANNSLAQMFGTSAENLVGIRCCELYHNSKKPRPDCTIMRTVTERMPQKVELNDRLHGRVLRVITDPIINNENGRVVGVVCTTRDVTDEKLIERRLIQQERISAIGEITAGIAHEVGTPLNIISANVEFLTRANKDLQKSEEIAAIREQTSNITQLVKQLLDFSREHSREFTPVNINDLIEKTIGLLNHQLHGSDIKIRLNLAPYLPTVDGDASQIQQVLFNLITNARQAMETGAGGEKILRIVTDTAFLPTETYRRPHIVITISDNGRGIPEDAVPNVFNPFFTANKEGGTGLGLAISHRIVQRHLGLLTIENNRTDGATATVRLPLSQS
ncbi:MAG: PAS domain S-box protein [Acidobacteriota bacterium]|nr:PAS domain S-box protein [Acidobacteriota bacterium]